MGSTDTKPNLVLVHSFPTNSILLSGLIEFLEDYFNIYFIDLPGCISTNPPLKKISLKNFSKYLDKKIEEINLDQYIIGGISFGYWVVSHAKLNNKCRGILAVEPYINSRYVKVPLSYRIKYKILFWLLGFFELYRVLWKADSLMKYYRKIANYPLKRVETIMREFDAKTFYVITKTLMFYKDRPKFFDLPYVLLINPKDKIIDADKVHVLFERKVEKLLVVETKIGHYPRTVTKRYFQRIIPKETINQVLDFLA